MEGKWELGDVGDVGVVGMELVLLVAFLPGGELLVGGGPGEDPVTIAFRVYEYSKGKVRGPGVGLGLMVGARCEAVGGCIV